MDIISLDRPQRSPLSVCVFVVLLFDTHPAEQRAMHLLRRVRDRIGNRAELDVRKWSSDHLLEPQAWQPLCQDLTQAHVLILAADHNPEILHAIQSGTAHSWNVASAEYAIIALLDHPRASNNRLVRAALAQLEQDAIFPSTDRPRAEGI